MQKPLYTTKQVAAIFEKSQETIRTWSNEFKVFLDSQANPGRGRSRAFTENDLVVFALVEQYKNNGFVYADCHEALQNGERGTPPEVDLSDLSRSLTANTEKRLLQQIDALHDQVKSLITERDTALASAKEAHALELEVTRLTQQVKMLIEDRNELRSKLDLLLQENQQQAIQIGQFATRVEILTEELDRLRGN